MSQWVTIRICLSEMPIARTPVSFNREQISVEVLPVPEMSNITMFVWTDVGSIETPEILATPSANFRAFS
jgi:hypothetical protein